MAKKKMQEPTQEEIAQRAWEISQSDEAGTPEENWQRAADELRGEHGNGQTAA